MLVSLDGRSAYDTVSRAAFLSKLRQVAPALLPFVRLFYGQPSVYCWWADSGTCRVICQAEGCEQGDALAPALFSLGQHDGLERAAAELRPGEELLAYLDDLYVITSPARAKPALDVVATRVEEHCGIASNVGKTRIYNTAGAPAPCGVAELGEEVWRSDRPLPERGFTALGVPIGHCDYVREWGQRRLREEQALLDHLPHLPDLQCAWLLLLMCASTRATHALRNIPPEDVRPYAEGRDRAVCAALHECLGEPTVEGEPLASTAWAVAATPATQGGLGLQSAMRTAPAAYWGAGRTRYRVLACTATALGGGMCAGTGARRSRPRPMPLQTFCEARDGRSAPLGQHSSAPHAQPRVPGKPGLATGLTAGSSTHRVHAHFTSAIECYCPPWSRLTRRCCCPSRVPKPPRGSRPYPRTEQPCTRLAQLEAGARACKCMISKSIRTAAATRFRSAPAAAGCERELEPEPAAQRDLHCLRGERGVGVAWDIAWSHAAACGPAWGRKSARWEGGKEGSSTWSRKNRFRVRDAQCRHPCLHSPSSAIPSGRSGGRAPCSTSSQEGTSVHPSTTSSLRASEAVRRQAGPRASVRQRTAHSEKAGRRSRSTPRASAQAAQ